jgi:hypothetical protein
MSFRIKQILAGATVTGAVPATQISGLGNVRSYQATLGGTGTYSATVQIQVSNDGVFWFTLNTFTLTNTAPTQVFTSTDAYAYVLANVTAITGTGAVANVVLAT